MINLSNQTILITGGTGTVGRSLVQAITNLPPKFRPNRLNILSRDEHKQHLLQKELNHQHDLRFDFILADINNYDHLLSCINGIDTVIHAAALKRVETAEKQPSAFTATNITGTENVLLAATLRGVKQIITISTDKAVYPTTLYGATKLCSERLALSKNLKGQLKSSVIRLGNIFGSRGSIGTELIGSKNQQKIKITHPDMSRFTISAQDSANYILAQISTAIGGEVFIPKMKAYQLVDLIQAFSAHWEIEFSSPRFTEKIHETLLSEEEARYALERDHDFIISMDEKTFNHYHQQADIFKAEIKSFSSNSAPKLSHDELVDLIKIFKS